MSSTANDANFHYGMNEDIIKRLEAQDVKLNAILESNEKMRKYFLWTLIVSVGMVVLPLIGILFVLPSLFSGLSSVSMI